MIPLIALLSCFSATDAEANGEHLKALEAETVDWKAKEPSYWMEVLSPEQLRVCREAGTERPWSSPLNKAKGEGAFLCSSCSQPLFAGTDKFESGTGWPSFTQPLDEEAVTLHSDLALGMMRTEVKCSRCDAHLGHVFGNGPAPTGKHYCINGVCLIEPAAD